MDVDDALELLSTSYKHEKVRQYALSRLWKADDEVSILTTFSYYIKLFYLDFYTFKQLITFLAFVVIPSSIGTSFKV